MFVSVGFFLLIWGNVNHFKPMKQTLRSSNITEAEKNFEAEKAAKEAEIDKLIKQISIYTWCAWSLVAIGFIIAWAGWHFLSFGESKTFYNLNLLGDFYGGTVASVWSLAGLFFIYIAFLGQKHQILNQQIEMKYSHLELIYTRMELKGQKQEMIEQNKTLRQQRFENTFFQLLNNFIRLADEVKTSKNRVFENFHQGILVKMHNIQINSRPYQGSINDMKNTLKSSTIEQAKKGYIEFHKREKQEVDIYIRSLYHLLKFIDNSQVDDKVFYANLVRTKLTEHELAFIFYDCLGYPNSANFKTLIEKYALLEHLNQELVFNQEHLDFFLPSAYGK
jgi:hypothetical protein